MSRDLSDIMSAAGVAVTPQSAGGSAPTERRVIGGPPKQLSAEEEANLTPAVARFIEEERVGEALQASMESSNTAEKATEQQMLQMTSWKDLGETTRRRWKISINELRGHVLHVRDCQKCSELY